MPEQSSNTRRSASTRPSGSTSTPKPASPPPPLPVGVLGVRQHRHRRPAHRWPQRCAALGWGGYRNGRIPTSAMRYSPASNYLHPAASLPRRRLYAAAAAGLDLRQRLPTSFQRGHTAGSSCHGVGLGRHRRAHRRPRPAFANREFAWLCATPSATLGAAGVGATGRAGRGAPSATARAAGSARLLSLSRGTSKPSAPSPPTPTCPPPPAHPSPVRTPATNGSGRHVGRQPAGGGVSGAGQRRGHRDGAQRLERRPRRHRRCRPRPRHHPQPSDLDVVIRLPTTTSTTPSARCASTPNHTFGHHRRGTSDVAAVATHRRDPQDSLISTWMTRRTARPIRRDPRPQRRTRTTTPCTPARGGRIAASPPPSPPSAR